VKKQTVSIVMLVVFTGSAILNYAILLHWAKFTPKAFVDSMETSILEIHALFVTLILGALFAKKTIKGKAPLPLAVVAICSTVAWSVFLVMAWRGYPSQDVRIDSVASALDSHSKHAGFLLTGIMSYLFGSGSEPEHP
jgi:hypothetical protein